MSPARLALLLACGIALAPHGAAAGAPFDYREYGALLARHVGDDGLVDYAGLAGERARLEAVVGRFGAVDAATYGSWSADDRLAFLINAYNAYTLAKVVRNYPIESIKRLPDPWDRREWSLLGARVSLNQIEHDYIRERFAEPRIHLALVCAARGCPPLLDEPWRGAELERQLAVPLARFLADPRKFRIDRRRGVVFLSRIFEWYGADFVARHAPPRGFGDFDPSTRAVLAFLAAHLPRADAELLERGEYTVRFLEYDWSLNAR